MSRTPAQRHAYETNLALHRIAAHLDALADYAGGPQLTEAARLVRNVRAHDIRPRMSEADRDATSIIDPQETTR